jgi:hypothetical protein
MDEWMKGGREREGGREKNLETNIHFYYIYIYKYIKERDRERER